MLLIPAICFSQKSKNATPLPKRKSETPLQMQKRIDFEHTLKVGQKDTLILASIWLNDDPGKSGKPFDGWARKDRATFSNPNSLKDFLTLDKKRHSPKNVVNRYLEK